MYQILFPLSAACFLYEAYVTWSPFRRGISLILACQSLMGWQASTA